jgi:hypothetical protein
MNERIKELYDQALETKFDYGGGVGVKPGEYYSNYITVLNPEKFAELIVRECAEVCMKEIDTGWVTAPKSPWMAKQILEHFGVE